MDHLVIFRTCCKLGKSTVECTDGDEHPNIATRLQRYKRGFGSEQNFLQYLPIIYICLCIACSPLGIYVHAFMIVYEPQTKLSIGSDAKHSDGREIYKRDSADRLLEVLHEASTKSVAQLRAGKTTLIKLKKASPEDIPPKEEFNSSADL